MNDFGRDSSDRIQEINNPGLEMGNVIRNQYANEKTAERYENAKQEMSFTFTEGFLQDTDQFSGTLNGWLEGLAISFLGDCAVEFIQESSPPEVPSVADYPSIAQAPEMPNPYAGIQNPYAGIQNPYTGIVEPLNGIADTMENLPVVDETTDMNAFIVMIENIQTQLNDLLNGLLGIVAPTETVNDVNDFTEANYEGAAAEALRLCFPPDVIENWENIPPEQREMCIVNYATYLNQTLGISINSISFEQMNVGSFGYCTSNGDIAINTLIMDDQDEIGSVIDTITHEAYHQFQHEVVANPERFDIPPETVTEWQNNFNSYISPRDDFQGYATQPVEVTAVNFAANVMQQAGLGNFDPYTFIV